MIENIAIWGGVAGLIASIFAIIVMFLTRHNILDILDKDVILFDKNFELKKEAITKALEISDEVCKKGKSILNTPAAIEQAQKCYNDLLCVATDVKLSEEFYNIAFNPNYEVNEVRNAQFKLMCRKDIGLKIKKAKAVKFAAMKMADEMNNNSTGFGSAQPYQPLSSTSYTGEPEPQPIQPVQPEQPIQQAQPTPVSTPRPRPQPMQRPVGPRPTATRVQPGAPAQRRISKPTDSGNKQ